MPQAKPAFVNLEGYLAAKTLVEGRNHAGRDLSRAKLITALEGMHKVDLGGYTIGFSPNNHNASRQVLLSVIVSHEGKFLFL